MEITKTITIDKRQMGYADFMRKIIERQLAEAIFDVIGIGGKAAVEIGCKQTDCEAGADYMRYSFIEYKYSVTITKAEEPMCPLCGSYKVR